ncbi:MAG: flagellar protein [Alphaproteobacteria bacterium]|nr:flagellar protein [Alphaproteobacteria bacterium]
MASNITLSASVRQNLLALQNTADLMSATQNKLATGKKVNSALDNPGSFFTSQALSNRATDLNSLLDSIGQAQQVLKAADTGLGSLTKLVESAKSIAKQAQQAPQAGSTTYNAFAVTGDPTNETLASHDGGAVTIANTTAYSFDININGLGARTINYTSDADATEAEIVAGLQADLATELAAAVGGSSFTGRVTIATGAGGDDLVVSAVDADIDFVIANATANTGLTNNTYNSTSLLDNIGSSGQTLSVQVNGGANQILTFGTGAGQISTLAELNTAIGGIAGVTGSANNAAFTLNVASTTSAQNSLVLAASNANLATALGIAQNSTTQGTVTIGAPNATRTSLEQDYNNVMSQLDALVRDSSYNGINLLNGDDFKVLFNETGTSFLTIPGVTFDATGLGLNAIGVGHFQADGNIETEIGKLDTALSSLRNQASKFGSTLTTVQIRQDFTKNLINTLETGADNLVLADTNAEGANLLALQTRQQLSTTALSLSAQADQAVLRLFG